VGDDSDKTEEPSDHKLQEARKKGQVLKSQDVISTGILLAAGYMFLFTGPWMYKNITEYTVKMWELIEHPALDDTPLILMIVNFCIVVLMSVMPLLLGVVLMGIVANVAQIKLLFTFETMKPSLSKINPIEGFKKIVSFKSIIELVKQLLKLAVIGYLCWKAVAADIPSFTVAPTWSLEQTADFVMVLIRRCLQWVVMGSVVLAAADYGWQYKQFMKQMRMSHQEMKDEYKETEGNPHVKAKMRQMMRQGAQGRMMEEVPNASAVVTNPTHMAIAIRYKQGEDQVPMVVAKGERVKAQQIKVLAEDNEIPIIENVELARALFGACKVGQAIPTELYKAVAEILAYVMKLKRKKQLKLKQQRKK
jgi:flagellar biosynthetic protein FlhB